MTDRYLTDTHAIITGGGRGIGAAIASALAQRGANLTLVGRTLKVLDEHAAHLRATHQVQVETAVCDVAEEAQVRQVFAGAIARFGAPYVLVNNAGQATSAPFTELTCETWDRMIAVNVTGTYLCTAQVLPAMLSARRGRIINIASTAGLRGFATMTAYCATKHAVIGLTRALALETAKQGITVNAVCPGYTDTDMAALAIHNVVTKAGKTEAEARAIIERTNPQGRLIAPEEVASLVAWLCTDDAAGVTGASLPVAGGLVT